MGSYFSTALGEGIYAHGDCSNGHHILRCEFCDCSFPANTLGKHCSEKKHLQNVASNNPVTPYRSPLPPSNLPNSRLTSLPSIPSSAIGVPVPIASGPRVTVSHESGLDFVVEGTEIAGRTSFPPVNLAILIEKTEVESSLSISSLRLVRTSDTPASCFTASVSGKVIRERMPCRIIVTFQAPHAGTFRMSLQIVFSDSTRPSGEEFVVLRELRGRANPQHLSLPSTPSPAIGLPLPIASDPRVTVSHESGLDFIVEGTEIAGRTSFSPVNLAILIEKTEVESSLSISIVKLVRTSNTPASCFSASVNGNARMPCRIIITFQAPHAGTFRMSLQFVFRDNTRPSGKEFVVLRELRGRANSQRVSLPSTPSPAIGVPIPIASGPRVTVSHENGLDFVVERAEMAGRTSFPPVNLPILIEKTEVESSLSIPVLKLVRTSNTPASCFTASVYGNAIEPRMPRRIIVTFQAPHAGTFRMSLQIVFRDSTQPSGKEFVVLRELRGRATLSSRHVGGVHLGEPSPVSSEVISPASEISHLGDGDYDDGNYDDDDDYDDYDGGIYDDDIYDGIYDDGIYDDDIYDDGIYDGDDYDDGDCDDGDYDDGIYDDDLYDGGDYDGGDYDDGDYGDGDGDDDDDDGLSAHPGSGACTPEPVPPPIVMPVPDLSHTASGNPVSSMLPPADVDSVRNTDENSPQASIFSGGSRDSIIVRADLLREQAKAEEKERDRLRAQQKKAWSEKRYADAVRFKVEQDEANERVKNLHRRAEEQYFKAHNFQSGDERTIDVHRLKAVEATRRTEVAIRDALLAGATRLRVICGRGTHSKGGIPVLKRALISAMEQCKIETEVDPNNPGILNIRLPVS